jgi:hypothetical protein
MKLAAAAGLIALAAAAPDKPKLDMTTFFIGKSHAENVMKVALHGPKKLIVDSVGGRNKEGEFVLIDTVHEEGKPVRTRTWVMHQIGAGHFAGTLTDATGPVDITVRGDTAVIRYTMKGGLNIVETMQLQPDGRSISNQVVAKKFGMTFAHVDGTIRRLD